jgi:hypothetical protein
MEKTLEEIEALKAKKEELMIQVRAINKKLDKEYSKQSAKSRYDTDEEYRKKKNEDAKARYKRLRQLQLDENKKCLINDL